MGQVNIRRLHTIYHLSAEHEDLRARLDRVRDCMIREGLEAALDRLGVDPEEEICLRRIHAPMRLRMSDPDAALELDWSLALARGIEAGLKKEGNLDMVRYRTRLSALTDLASGIARKDYRRIWAWRQIGLWKGTGGIGIGDDEAAGQLVEALRCQGSAVIPVLCALAEEGLLDLINARLRVEDWIALAKSAIDAAGGDVRLIESPLYDFSVEAPVEARALRAARGSVLGPMAQGIAGTDIQLRWAIGSLVLLAYDPAALQCLTPAQLIAATVQSLWKDSNNDESFPAGEENTGRRKNVRRYLRHEDNEKRRLSAADPERESSTRADEWRPDRADANADAGILEDVPVPPSPASATVADDHRAAADVRARGRTRWGGLLFLLWLVDECEIPRLAAERMPGRNLRSILYRLAHSLLHMDAGDPASFAFAGLPPDAQPPTEAEPATTPDEDCQIEAFAETIREALEERLTDTGEASPVRQVCARRAEIVADPGWIEVHLSLEEVSTQLRHCGLDLNPEYMPWLGVVMRFIYE
jgi:hypothetical protein